MSHSPPPLARSGVDRAAANRADPHWLEAAWSRARVLVVDDSGRALCGSGEPSAASPHRPELAFLDPADAPAGQRLFLGVDAQQVPYFAVVAPLPEHKEAQPVSLREVGASLGDRDAGLFTTAVALAKWHAAHRHAPRTGAPTELAAGGWVRVDPDGEQLFPRTDPAVIVLVHDGVAGPGGRCLLGHNAAWRRRQGPRFFSVLAGFVEAGESAEAAVVREVHEEVGVRVSRLRYLGSQAWPYPGSLMLGFTGYADPAGALCPDLAEIAEARWFTRDEVAALLPQAPGPSGVPYGAAPAGSEIALPGPASIAHYLIRCWLREADAGLGSGC